MNIMVVGGGGREHALIKKIKESPLADKIYALPGNGGIAADAECVDIGAKEIDKIVDFAVKSKIDFAIVAPDDPLVMGAVDRLNEKGIPCFGPEKKAAAIEGSKIFAKDLMKKYNIPTARYDVASSASEALKIIEGSSFPLVVKADGLALGKGVVIAQNKKEAEEAVRSMMEDKIFGESGANIVIEEFLEGPEVSVLAFTDGKTIKPMISSMDHKRALDDDKGLNTGGMGTVAPNPYYTKAVEKECMEKIFIPTVNAMNSEGRTFKGCLYFGLMITKDGPKVIEYNCRFGDPETQVVLPLLKGDLLDIMIKTSKGRLEEAKVENSDEYACCVIMASEGYPGKYEKGFEITVDGDFSDAEIYIAGAKKENGRLLTAGGRVLGVTAIAPDLEGAINKAYEKTKKVHFANSYMRKDIGKRALAAKNGEN